MRYVVTKSGPHWSSVCWDESWVIQTPTNVVDRVDSLRRVGDRSHDAHRLCRKIVHDDVTCVAKRRLSKHHRVGWHKSQNVGAPCVVPRERRRPVCEARADVTPLHLLATSCSDTSHQIRCTQNKSRQCYVVSDENICWTIKASRQFFTFQYCFEANMYSPKWRLRIRSLYESCFRSEKSRVSIGMTSPK